MASQSSICGPIVPLFCSQYLHFTLVPASDDFKLTPHSLVNRRSRRKSYECWRALANNCRVWSKHAAVADKQQPGAEPSSKSRDERAEINGLCDQLDAKNAHHHQLNSNLCAASVSLASKKEKFSVLDAKYYCFTNGRRRLAFGTEEERKPKQGRASDFFNHLPLI